MQIIEVPISQVKNWKHNPRSIQEKDFKRLQKQLKEHKQFKPLVCFKENGSYITLGGNMRLKAMQKLGFLKVAIIEVVAKTKKERIKLSLIDNDRSGYYDDQALAELIYPFKDELSLKDFKVDLKIPDMDLGNVLDRYAPSNEKDDEIPVVKKTKIKLGDMFQLGRHRLLCGDATKKEDVERLMDGKKADMVFTDPPYGLSYKYNSYEDIEGNEYLEFCNKWFVNIENSPFIAITTGWKYMSYWWLKKPKDIMYWICRNKQSGGTVFHYRRVEPIFIWGKPKEIYNFDFFESLTDRFDGLRDKHSCPKPIKFCEDVIRGVNVDNLILDLFLGSGSTLIACEKLNRICYGTEIDPQYCQVIIDRWQNYTNQKAVKVG